MRHHNEEGSKDSLLPKGILKGESPYFKETAAHVSLLLFGTNYGTRMRRRNAMGIYTNKHRTRRMMSILNVVPSAIYYMLPCSASSATPHAINLST